MSPRKRPTLDALAGRIAAKSGGLAAPALPGGRDESGQTPRRPGRPARPAARQKAILIRTSPEDWKALKNIATDRETTLRAVVQEAIDAFLMAQGRPPRA